MIKSAIVPIILYWRAFDRGILFILVPIEKGLFWLAGQESPGLGPTKLNPLWSIQPKKIASYFDYES